MVLGVYLPLVFGIVIAVTHYYANRVKVRRRHYSQKVISFAAGISITYVLLELFPTFTEVALSISKLLFISLLIGFITHHLIEKEIYKHNRSHQLVKLISIEENVFSFVYHVILGVVFVTLFQESLLEGIIAFIPILTFTLVSTLPMEPHHSKWKAALMASSTVLGVLFALLWKTIPVGFEFFLVGLATGVLLFTVIRHHIPFGRDGNIGYFTIGFITYALFIVMTWYI
ncbi:hypothetical protein COV20_03500 [Candidatus Woesearchaeota archaeon CG10_big_fil_rev_8_21_14_0_10_45_16]|nr:MAG: hypothetical protein COV20_03500 [Candidatus Woesearchaeota archaeon CG10_big_fil_rev_8_21_14_0_10_45_16]